ncbi:MAG: threonine/serine dehydratase [Bacteroidetes bacterium]|nr:MAG: threonine/serine dehydratase [Bacteroidota bacterium]
MSNVSLPHIQSAHDRIRPYIHRTPILTSETLNQRSGASLFFKCENFQKIGAFKIRGGMNAALSLSPEELQKGLATHSSGNHAQAIAYAARQLGVKAYIVMPHTSPKVKVAAVQGYGGEVIFCEPNQQARESTLREVVERTGASFIHPYDDDRVIAGQATCAKELIEDVPDLNAVIAPVGGGGLMSGSALSRHYLLPGGKMYAGEPEGAADAILSFQSGKVEKAPFVSTIADGLMTALSPRTLGIIREHVTEIILVSEAEIIEALRLVYERMKIVVEPSCVVPLAAVLKRRDLFEGQGVGIILTGGNVDLTQIGRWLS